MPEPGESDYLDIGAGRSLSEQASQDEADHRPVQRPTHPGLLATLRNYTNPLYYVRKLREDLRLALRALRNHDLSKVRCSEADLAAYFRGKLFGAFFVSGGANLLGIALGTYLQYLAHQTWVGVIGTILSCFTFSNTAFFIVWTASNRQLYRQVEPNFARRLLRAFHDYRPIFLTGARFAVIITVVSMPIERATHWSVETIWPGVVNYVPMSVLVFLVDILFISTPFIRAMGDLFERHSHELAHAYLTPVAPSSR